MEVCRLSALEEKGRYVGPALKFIWRQSPASPLIIYVVYRLFGALGTCSIPVLQTVYRSFSQTCKWVAGIGEIFFENGAVSKFSV